jgi:hypothetical protein
MVVSLLTNELIQEGRVLIQKLDAGDTKLDAALWFYFTDGSEWKLMLALPTLDRHGPKAAYVKVHKVFSKLTGLSNLALTDITVVSPNEQLVGSLRAVIRRTGPYLSDVRFSSAFFNRVFIQDAYVYRLN